MSVFGILISIYLFGVVKAPGGDHHATLMCLECPMVDNIPDCLTYRKCHPEQTCGTEVHYVNGKTVYSVGCQKVQDCQHWHPLHLAHYPHKTMVDYNCCDSKDCNLHMFDTTTPVTQAATVTTTTTVPMTNTTAASTSIVSIVSATAHPPVSSSTKVYDPACFDREEDGVSCASLDLFNLCGDTSTFGYVLSHQKCARHCGLCTPTIMTTKAPAPVPPSTTCADYEQDGIQCMFMDLYSFCTDTSMLAYVIAHTKCRKHCGMCTAGK